MSGIAGVYHLDGRPVGEELDRMLDGMEHRGPDGADTWCDGPVGLGHLMLETTPEDEYESLPLVDRSGNFAITADARIDNRDALIKTFDVRKPDDRPITDTELILEAYKRWGRDCPKKLLGAFSFAVWNAQSRALMLARDHLGIRPLYYVHRPGKFFAFASEEKALVEAGFSQGSANDLRIASFLLVPVQIEPEATFWKDISSARRASTLEVTRDGEVNFEQYWSLDPDREIELSSDEAYAERFRELFQEAVRCRMRTTTPISAALSGGLDSTSIACVAARKSKRKIQTLSAVFPSVPRSDEREYQEAALEMYGEAMDPIIIAADEISPLKYENWFTSQLGRPHGGINAFITIELYKRAVENGSRVVLSGIDGDTAVSNGKAYYNELLWSWQWLTLWREVRGAVHGWGGDDEDVKRVFKGWIKYYLRRSTLTGPLVDLLHTVRNGESGRNGQPENLKIAPTGNSWGHGWKRYFDEDFLSSISDHLDEQINDVKWTEERHHHYAMLTRPLMEGAYRKLDAMGSSLGIDVRYPFQDVRLVEFCLALPGHLKRRKQWRRWIQRVAMDGIIPEKVQWRQDIVDLRWNYINGLEKYEKDKMNYFAGEMGSDKGPASEYIDSSTVSNVSAKMANENLRDEDEEAERVMLWRSLRLNEWLKEGEMTKSK